MNSKYVKFSQNQICQTKEKLRKKIFFLLVIADPVTCCDYAEIDVKEAFQNVLVLIDGYNQIFQYPQQIVDLSSLLVEALKEYSNPNFNFKRYRKLILDSGNLVLKIKEV